MTFPVVQEIGAIIYADPVDRQRQKKRATISLPRSSLRGAWTAPFREALREFNTLSRTHSLGVTMTQSNDARTDSGGANVGVEVANGQISCR